MEGDGDALLDEMEDLVAPAYVYVTTETKRFVCQICRKDFVTTQALKRHEQTVHSPNLERIPCTVCDAKFTRIDGIRKHMRKFHAGVEYPQRPASPSQQLPHPKRKLLEDGDEEDGRFEEEDVAKDDTVIDPPRDGLTEVVEFRVSTS